MIFNISADQGVPKEDVLAANGMEDEARIGGGPGDGVGGDELGCEKGVLIEPQREDSSMGLLG